MSRSIHLVVDLLSEIKDAKTLMDIAVALKDEPEAEKKYLRDNEREQICDDALNLVKKILHDNLTDVKRNTHLSKSDMKKIFLDARYIHQTYSKTWGTRDSVYSKIFVQMTKLLKSVLGGSETVEDSNTSGGGKKKQTGLQLRAATEWRFDGLDLGVSDLNGSNAGDDSFCSVKLPSVKPLAPSNSEVAKRLFIVCQPGLPPLYSLKDVFGRFGSLIDVYILPGKNCGYASYADASSADQAIQTLHGAEMYGSRLKVMEADPPKGDRNRKRQRLDD
ncbi:uncharacterized protein LOC103509613 [Diaphorina citri]|uniref:Uncharacterized protein LOC103509613 n=1 Tax=Diaphorina citri TaxID=121845 RepID=A0A3Q0IYF0_DIACI|nr:uncharacterized protein LOC103509613 [Diaphorina citri]